MAKPFVTPFATGGDKSAVPDASQADGSVSYTQGFGPAYQQEQGTPGAKDVPRDKTNQIFSDITGAISELQRLGFAEYYPELAPYSQGATVWRAGTVYMSTAGNNNTVPGAVGASWIVLGGDTTPVGTSIMFNADSPPTGYLVENGQTLNRSGQYAALFSVIGTRFGAGNGSTTFSLPESRGEFVRALDAGRGVDANRAIGTYQADAIRAHRHANGVGTTVGAVHPYVYGQTTQDLPGIASSVVTESTGFPNDQGWTSFTDGQETRPRNVAKLFCIKF